MLNIDKITQQVAAMSDQELREFQTWFTEFNEQRWETHLVPGHHTGDDPSEPPVIEEAHGPPFDVDD